MKPVGEEHISKVIGLSDVVISDTELHAKDAITHNIEMIQQQWKTFLENLSRVSVLILCRFGHHSIF